MDTGDIKTLGAGALAWAVAVPAVKIAGKACANSKRNTYFAMLFGLGLAAITTPAMSKILGWKTPHQRVRGIALALGAAQVIDGVVHMLMPKFYTNDHRVGVACAGNIFFGAGLLGIFSAYQ